MFPKLKNMAKIAKTGNLYLSYFSLGLSAAVVGPSLLDLQHLVHSDMEHMALTYTVRYSGYIIGAIIGGIIFDLVKKKQVVLMGCNIFVAASMFGLPWSRNFEALIGFMVLNGLALGVLETGGNVLCLRLWGKDSNPFFQALQFSFGLGGLISPLIVAPFLETFQELSPALNNSTFTENPFFVSPTNVSTSELQGIPKITCPYSIVGAFALLVAILDLLISIIFPSEDECCQDGERKKNSVKSFSFILFTVIFTAFFMFLMTGAEMGYAHTLTTYAAKGNLHVTTTVGSYMTSVFWAVFTLSRLASVFLAMQISNVVLLTSDIVVASMAAVILLFFMPNEWALWLATVIFGIGMASVYAALIGWAGIHIDISNKISAIFTVGGAAGEVVVPFITTYFIESIPEIFEYVTAVTCVLMAILIVAMKCLFRMENKFSESKILKAKSFTQMFK